MSTPPRREGSLDAPTRHPLDWKSWQFYDDELLNKELERVFDICHGCRRCVSLCNSFPVLFDLVDSSKTGEVDGVAKTDYMKVVDECYLCDLCYMTKCPYVPPHEWNVDYPHLMLRAKAAKFRKGQTKLRDMVLSSTDTVGRLAGIPVIVDVVNAANKNPTARKILQRTLGVHTEARIPEYHSDTLRKRHQDRAVTVSGPTAQTTGRVALFTTCYGNYNEPQIGADLIAVFQHNGIEVKLVEQEQCCGMPKLELGDLEAVAKAKEANIPELLRMIDQGYDIVAPVPSCVLMFKQELPLMFPNDDDVKRVKKNIFDPFEYLALRHKDGKLNTTFNKSLGKVAYHVPCHTRVQNIGLKTRDILSLIPNTQVETIERCSGHDGTYAVKEEFHAAAVKIGRPVANRVQQAQADYYGSDCPMAAHHIESIARSGKPPVHPLSMLRLAYGI